MLLKDVVPSLQNPALDWNEGRRPSSTPTALENMLPIVPSFNLSVVFAPAIIYRETIVVCGHSVEVFTRFSFCMLSFKFLVNKINGILLERIFLLLKMKIYG